MPARALMFQGTGSDVGKSLIVTGLARAFTQRGLKILPFKPQNMSNNAAVTADGGEIGRAQALQARAAHTPPSVHMNPVLLKPQSAIGAQVVVQGRVFCRGVKADAYQRMKCKLLPFVLDSFARLRAQADVVLIEGAGSSAEVNLRADDIANMGFARAANVPVVLVGDIDRGGVIASIVGTKTVITPDDAALIAGFIINKFRGDAVLFAAGMERISQLTGWESLGLVPFFPDAHLLPAEDALALETHRPILPRAAGEGDRAEGAVEGARVARSGYAPDAPTTTLARYASFVRSPSPAPLRSAGEDARKRVRIAVPILPHIANFDDLDPLAAEPVVELVHVRPGDALPGDADLVVLPGSKATLADLAALRSAGFDIDIAAHRRRGGMILGLCGGYQMIGRIVADPDGIEGPPATLPGLGLLDVTTTLSGEKRLEAARGVTSDGAPYAGYEMHMGTTEGPDCARPFGQLADGSREGAVSPDGRVIGTYIHGLFADDRQRTAWLARFAAGATNIAYDPTIERTLDALAAHLAAHLDLDRLLKLAR